MTLSKKILFYSLLLLLILAAVEGMARVAYYFAYAEWYSIPPTLRLPSTPNSVEYRPVLAWDGIERISHPYYGYTEPSPTADLNRMHPPQTGENTVVIGVLGGSVAYQLTPYFRSAALRYFADNTLAKKPVILNLGYYGMRQPQQLHIVSQLLALGGGFDIIVNLDGFNTLTESHRNFQSGVFPFFPATWQILIPRTVEEIALIGNIRVLRAELTALRQASQSSPFRTSAAWGLLNRYRSQRLENRILRLNYDLAVTETSYSLERHGPAGNFSNTAEVHEEAVRVWYRSSALLSLIADRTGADYYHFLQPNQYVPDSKPLSPEELRRFYKPDWAARADYPQTYPLLVQYSQELQRQGVHYFDLTQIFADHPETLYSDRCCHLNARGNELLAASMVERLAPALLRRGRAVAAPDSILAAAAPPPVPPPTPALTVALSPGAAPGLAAFQVYRRPGNILEYVQDDCFPQHTQARFFLHITPVSAADLPENRRELGFDNRDFRFSADGGIQFDRYCAINRRLPSYPIAGIRTGQYNAAGDIWAVELSLPE